VARIRAGDAHHALAAQHLAALTNPFNRTSDFHAISPEKIKAYLFIKNRLPCPAHSPLSG
jgi:hypothetical protein